AEKPVQRKDLPAAVEKTVAKEIEGATLKGLSKEPCEGKDKGANCYEVETMKGGRSRDLIVDSTGRVVEVEEGIATADLPEPVKVAGGKLGRVLSAERVTVDGAISYELVVEKAGKKSEHAYLPDGSARK
ncbi:MAG: hypothetical protein ABI565_13155, partial [Vicinamibacteria bacterium]